MDKPRSFENFLRLLRRSTDLLNEDPIREEIFSVERLEAYAHHLAAELVVLPGSARGRSLLPDLEDNGRQLLEVYLNLAAAIHAKRNNFSPAAELFVDNFYIIEEQIRQIRRDLPKQFYRELPKLADGELKGLPRVYAVALGILSHTDGRLDVDSLRRYLVAFQTVTVLTIGELWAVAITLRIALLEHLRPLADRIISARLQRERADLLANALLSAVADPMTSSDHLIRLVSTELDRPEKFNRAYIVQLIQQLRDQDPAFLPVFAWLDAQLEVHNTNSSQVVQLDQNQLAAAQVTVGNIISSMRLLQTIDWCDFVEDTCGVHEVFLREPCGTYATMDFVTRNRYRSVVERLARGSSLAELEIARRVVAVASEASPGGATSPQAHIGYYLIGDGRFPFRAQVGFRERAFDRISRTVALHPTAFYLGAVAFGVTFLVGVVVLLLLKTGAPAIGIGLFALLAIVPSSELAICILNYLITAVVPPKPLPRLETRDGIPGTARTFIVIPTLLLSARGVDELVETLHVHALANPDPSLYFALLTDFADDDAEVAPADAPLLAQVLKGILALNDRYPTQGVARFHLFHRRRLWNLGEGKWMGYERKRGKLYEFNRLLRGATDTSYTPTALDATFLRTVEFVITLDSDTELPRGTARRLVGTALHPLNRPRYDALKGRVVEGYGILQPRVSVSLSSATRTRFASLFSGITGLDPYSPTVAEVYQDLFGEGCFTGKGLYVVDAFETALADRIPENTLLSHDLFEGLYARSGLVSDVELFDDFPEDHALFLRRQHRWTRGDWQLFPWLLPWVPNAAGGWQRNLLPVISRWKILDNLRRSIVPPAVILWLLLVWTVLPGSVLLWTTLIVLLSVFPIGARIAYSLTHYRRGLSASAYIRTECAEVGFQLEQILVNLAFLADQAYNQCDAIVRVVHRKLFSHTLLLEWATVDTFSARRHAALVRSEGMSSGSYLAVVLGVTIGAVHPVALPIAAPFLLAWFVTPLLKRRLRLPLPASQPTLTAEQVNTFRSYARRTWHFFEVFIGKGDHWLPPDNFQEDPSPVIAHRTSPTNMGLALLASVSAYEFGFLGLTALIERLENTLGTIDRLAKHRGHLLNWYDTQTLEPLRPQYVSTVDSGNLAGHLLSVRQSCLALAKNPGLSRDTRLGLMDTFTLLNTEVHRLAEIGISQGAASVQDLQGAIEALLAQVSLPSWTMTGDHLDALALKLTEAADIFTALKVEVPVALGAEICAWFDAARHQVEGFRHDFRRLSMATESTSALRLGWVVRLESLAERCDRLFSEMDFRFLLEPERQVFSIGFLVAEERLDRSSYDILASEARLTTFIAIAKGEASSESWFRLGRQMTPLKGGRALISWTATMFEYLMPLLVMRRYEGTLLDETYVSVVQRQIEYWRQQGVPWGISEAGYNARDMQLNFQYGAFGVPGLGLKRGLSADLVISPYSTMLAAMIEPIAALKNLQRLESLGALGRFGFYESIDYTVARLPPHQTFTLIRSFMSHHQGMSLIALNNLLGGSSAQEHFHAEPRVKATQLLLQEKVPLAVALVRPRAEEVHPTGPFLHATSPNVRTFEDVDLPTPRTQLLSNGTYSVMMTTTGAGYSRCGTLAIGRWREDTTRDHWGQFFYIRARRTGAVWSEAHQPLCGRPRHYKATLSEDKIEINRQDGDVLTRTEIVVSPEDNVELRCVSLTNMAHESRDFEITSYLETVLARPEEDDAHPAFSNLFIETEFVASENALLATRRRRSAEAAQTWGFHVAVVDGELISAPQYETDRLRFVGRGRDASQPFVITENRPLSNTVGAVLDPIFSLRMAVRIPAGKTVRITFTTGLAQSREDALRLADKYHDVHIFDRERELAWTKAQVQLRHLNIDMDTAHAFQRLAGRILYSDPSLRPHSRELSRNRRTQAALWAYGISGDLPLVLTSITDEKDVVMVRELLRAHEFLRLKGLAFDLVILNEHAPSYVQQLQEELHRQIRASSSFGLLDKPGGIFIRRTEAMPREDMVLLRTVARVNLIAAKGTLAHQLQRRPAAAALPTSRLPKHGATTWPNTALKRRDLAFFNGLGGFASEGREYHILLQEGQWTPAPWINVLANSCDFGTQVSESGSGFTWSINSRENRLTAWSNDAVSDPPGEVIYLRDEHSGEVWTPTPLPIREREPYLICHGQGYSQFTHHSHGIEQVLQVFVPIDESVKVSILHLKNTSNETRRISVTSYTEWVLGVRRDASVPFVSTEIDTFTGVILARNGYNNEFASRVSFAHMAGVGRSFTCDRKQFLGRNGSLLHPKALMRSELDGLSGAGLDPCAAIQIQLTLAPGETRTVVVLLGQAATVPQALSLATRYSDVAFASQALDRVKAYWDDALSTIQVRTPEPAMNLMLNRWLLYQTIVCRLWSRSAFYQSGGAYGFRDQLQDVMALVYSKPAVTRQQILRAAGRQFQEGDVQHWWHPPTGRGVRTGFSDDLLWLPFVTSFYLDTTDDDMLLDEQTPFLEAPLLEPGQESSYTVPSVMTETASVYEHCLRTLDRSLAVGRHGLPLMGSGDWNDGMNRVGLHGEGESVWVGWFLFATLKAFLPHVEKAGDLERCALYRKHMKDLQNALETHGWDGDWYRRAFFDDGTPLGSAANDECRIDSIAQSWAVLSGAADPVRAARAMAAVDDRLVDRSEGLIRLLTPPFDKGTSDPGYIKGYVPGVRENGGQYTHAALWTLMAFAELGDGDLAGELYSLLNPINHSMTRAGLHKYKVEPYVAAADIYGRAPHVGRGGWTWYTGSASWMYRAGLESILGFHRVGATPGRGATLCLKPCIPRGWREFELTYKHKSSTYHILVQNPQGVASLLEATTVLDGLPIDARMIPLVDDAQVHRVVMTLN